MKRRYVTQGTILVAELTRRAMTYREMMNLSGSLSPQKRVREALKWFPGYVLDTTGRKKVGGRELVAWRVTKA